MFISNFACDVNERRHWLCRVTMACFTRVTINVVSDPGQVDSTHALLIMQYTWYTVKHVKWRRTGARAQGCRVHYPDICRSHHVRPINWYEMRFSWLDIDVCLTRAIWNRARSQTLLLYNRTTAFLMFLVLAFNHLSKFSYLSCVVASGRPETKQKELVGPWIDGVCGNSCTVKCVDLPT